MPNSLLEKVEKAFMKTQTLAAKVFGTPRINVLRTDKMSEKLLAQYQRECDTFIQLASIAKQIEAAANNGGLKSVVSMARKCKINIKSDFEKFTKEMSKDTGDIKLSSGHLDSAKAEIKKLLADMRKPLVSMTEIYNTCVGTYNNLNVTEPSPFIQISPQPSAPPPEPYI